MLFFGEKSIHRGGLRIDHLFSAWERYMVDYLQDGPITYMMWEYRFVGVACVFMLLFFFVQVCVSSQQGVCLPMKEVLRLVRLRIKRGMGQG